MIVEGITAVLLGLVGFIGGLFPTMQVPAFVHSISGLVATVVGAMAPLGNWVPFGPAGTAVGAVILAAGVALVIRLVRIAASFLTGGGGGAA